VQPAAPPPAAPPSAAAPSPAAAATAIPDDGVLGGLKVTGDGGLKELCSQNGLKVSGTKPELVARLRQRRDAAQTAGGGAVEGAGSEPASTGAASSSAAGAASAGAASGDAAADGAGSGDAAADGAASGGETSGVESGDEDSGYSSSMSGGQTSGAEESDAEDAEDAEHVDAPDRRDEGVLEPPIEVAPHVVGGEKVGGLSTAVDVWYTHNQYQTHRYQKYDDRDRQATEAHGEQGQLLGERWANALQRH